MDYTFAITLGILGGLHCAAMCGPLQLALPMPPGGPGRIILGRIIYQLGRVTTYAMLGAIAGTIGRSLFVAGFQRSLSIALGVVIILGFLASKKVAVSAPAVRLVILLKSAMSSQLRQRSFRSLALLGLLNGLLPCGLVYVALAGAVAHGTVLQGMGYMAAFGLGTTPMLMGISLSGQLLPVAFRLRMRNAIPVGVCLLAGLLILRGMSLGIPYVSPDITSGTVPSCCAH